MNYGPSSRGHHHSISTGGGDPANSYYGGYGGLGAELGELFSYGSCDISAQTPPPPPPPTAKTGLRENPGKRPAGQATGRGTTPQPGTKTAATGPSDTAPVELHGSTTTPTAYNPAGTATMAAAEPSGGLGTVFPIDPGANDGTTLVNPLDTGAGAGLTSTFPLASDAGAGSTLINPIDPDAGTGWSSLFPVDPSAGLPTVALALPEGFETRYIHGGTEEGAAQLSQRAKDLQNQVGWSGTTAVVRVRSKADPGREMTLVSSNKLYMPASWKTRNSLLPGETYVQFLGHAERSVMEALSVGAGWEIIEGGTSTGVCWGGLFSQPDQYGCDCGRACEQESAAEFTVEDILDHVPVDVSHASLAQALRTAQQDSLVRFASMCLFKVVPLVEARSGRPLDEQVTERLHALEVEQESLAEVLEPLRDNVQRPLVESFREELGEACSMAEEVILRAFVNDFRIREWARRCSSLILDIHQEFDALLYPRDDEAPNFYPAPEQPELTPMEALELRDQVTALDLLRQGVGSDQLRTINEEGNSRVASALIRIVG
ncbi:hypothetical protein [Streptomyces mirabilis]|uniref:hypothetical protein n=1 Tax=Streptomyces mirabilis TaxID=68239 RepID=UPI0033F00D71